jgi:hypothetical protein
MASKFGEVPKLSLNQKLVLAIKGAVFIKYMKPEDYQGFVPVYVVRCLKHGLYLDNPHGYTHRLDCDECLAEEKKQKCHV